MTASDESLTTNDDLLDSSEGTSFRLAPIDVGLLTSSVVLRALGGLVFGLALLVWPDRTDRLLVRLVGVGLIWVAVVGFRAAWQRAGFRARSVPRPLVTLAVGAFLVLNPDRSVVFVGRLIGALLLVYVARSIIEQLRSDDRDWSRLPFLSVVAALALLLIVLTGELLSFVVAVGALLLVALCLLVLLVSLDGRTEGVANYRDTTDLVLNWLRDRPKSLDARRDLYAKILYEGPTTRLRIIRFFALMGFAAVIASMGVITDSTAVVIGAMLVAPLMTPLMGMAISLVMGWPNRLLRATLIALSGIVFAIGIGVLLGLIVPANIDTATNTQILARISPTTLDLITAIAAGAAGAYGLSRPDVSDSLPGVAIAISLVPPLTVVGIAWSQGDFEAGSGALLLFATNMIAIIVVGGLTFILTGVTPVDHAVGSGDRVRVALGAVTTMAILVVGSLLLNSAQIAGDALEQDTVVDAIEAWIPDDTGHRLVEADLNDGVVSAIVIGPSVGLPDVAELAEQLSDELDDTITVRASVVVEEQLIATGGDK